MKFCVFFIALSFFSGSLLFVKAELPILSMGLDAENYTIAPDLELEQVHVYVRHGERTPVGIRLNGPPAHIPEHWLLCKAGRRFKAAVWGPTDADRGSLQVHRLVERKDGTSTESECMLGELTDLGRQSTYRYGQSLRKLYVEKLGFLPDTIDRNDLVYFRSTNMPRTIESLQEVIHGLYPSSKTTEGISSKILIRNGKDENLIGNTFGCKRLETLNAQFAQAAAEALNPSLAPLDKKISKYVGGNPIRIDGKPRASGILDTVRAAKAHGIPVPREFDDPIVINQLERAVTTEWFGGYSNEEFRRLAMGRLLHDIQHKMQYKIDNRETDPLKILVHSTHDTALAGICATLGVFDQKWPDFTASVTFELFRKPTTVPPSSVEIDSNINPLAQPQDEAQSFLGSMYGSLSSPLRNGSTIHKPAAHEYYVRMRYQNRNMIIPHCFPSGKHLHGRPEYCTLAAFQERVKELTPLDWEQECAATGSAHTSTK